MYAFTEYELSWYCTMSVSSEDIRNVALIDRLYDRTRNMLHDGVYQSVRFLLFSDQRLCVYALMLLPCTIF